MKLGVCGWLLDGISLPEKIEFLANEGFSSVAWLQSIIDADRTEREETAAVIREKNFSLTYHGNVHHRLTVDHRVDSEFLNRVFEDVLWWHENTNGVTSCCSDMITTVLPDSGRTYLSQETFRVLRMEADFFEKYGIGYGIENAYLMPDGTGYCTLDEMNRMKDMLGNAPRAGMIFDVGHANVYLTSNNNGRMSLEDYVEKIPFRIYELHITDNHGFQDEHLLPGEGTLNFSQLRSGLERKGFDGIISFEICPDILNNKYAWDISKSENKDTIRRAKDRFLEAYLK